MTAPTATTTRLVRFYDCTGAEVGQPVYAVGRVVAGRHEEHYTNAATARDAWRAMQASLRALEAIRHGND
jgi:hypothetical protein